MEEEEGSPVGAGLLLLLLLLFAACPCSFRCCCSFNIRRRARFSSTRLRLALPVNSSENILLLLVVVVVVVVAVWLEDALAFCGWQSSRSRQSYSSTTVWLWKMVHRVAAVIILISILMAQRETNEATTNHLYFKSHTFQEVPKK